MIWIVGAGLMAKDYCKVLQAINVDFVVVGRGSESAKVFFNETNIQVIEGGVPTALTSQKIPTYAIVCTPVGSLCEVTKQLIDAGVKSILVEKPGSLYLTDLLSLKELADKTDALVSIGYNRRFFQSVLALEKLIEADGELTAVNFEITEWGHRIENELVESDVKQHWLLANSTHVIDLAFYLAGIPKQISSYMSGSLSWHPTAARFVGAGISEKNVLMSYFGYWDGAGRWSLELNTTQNRYVLRPMEKLSVQRRGTLALIDVEDIDYSLDEKFKPGLYLQVQAFIRGDLARLCSLADQINCFPIYQKIAGYSELGCVND